MSIKKHNRQTLSVKKTDSTIQKLSTFFLVIIFSLFLLTTNNVKADHEDVPDPATIDGSEYECPRGSDWVKVDNNEIVDDSEDGNENEASDENDSMSVISYTDPDGKSIYGVCVKGGREGNSPNGYAISFWADGEYPRRDGEDICFIVSGIGTPNVSVTHTNISEGTCAELSHASFYTGAPTSTPTSTPTPTSEITSTPTPTEEITPTDEITEAPTPTSEPTSTPTPTEQEDNDEDNDDDDNDDNNDDNNDSNNNVGGTESNPVVLAAIETSRPQVLSAVDNYNPLLDSIKKTGKVLGISTKRLPKTGVKVANWAMPKYPSSNKAMENSYIVINKIGINAPLYQASNIGDDLLVGDSEILNTGNMFYGHNSRSAFESLWQLRKGDSIIVTKNGNTQIYTVSNTAYINETEVEKTNTNNNEISLVTCVLGNSNLRLVVKASK